LTRVKKKKLKEPKGYVFTSISENKTTCAATGEKGGIFNRRGIRGEKRARADCPAKKFKTE